MLRCENDAVPETPAANCIVTVVAPAVSPFNKSVRPIVPVLLAPYAWNLAPLASVAAKVLAPLRAKLIIEIELAALCWQSAETATSRRPLEPIVTLNDWAVVNPAKLNDVVDSKVTTKLVVAPVANLLAVTAPLLIKAVVIALLAILAVPMVPLVTLIP